MLPRPAVSFTIPSLHDATPLNCRIYHPREWSSGNAKAKRPWRPQGAIFTHPYTSLGGNYDDHVVLSVVEKTVELGFVVGTFNFRYGVSELCYQ